MEDLSTTAFMRKPDLKFVFLRQCEESQDIDVIIFINSVRRLFESTERR